VGSNCDEVCLMQHAEGLILVVQGELEIESISFITPRSDHRVTLYHPLSKVPSFFLCQPQSVYEMTENFQIVDPKSSKFSRGRTERLDSDRHDQLKAVHASE
jgi:hypothetical protein